MILRDARLVILNDPTDRSRRCKGTVSENRYRVCFSRGGQINLLDIYYRNGNFDLYYFSEADNMEIKEVGVVWFQTNRDVVQLFAEFGYQSQCVLMLNIGMH